MDNSCESQIFHGTLDFSQLHSMNVLHPVDDQLDTVSADSSRFVPALPIDTPTRPSTIGSTRQFEIQGLASNPISAQISVLPASTGPPWDEDLDQYVELDVPGIVDVGRPGFVSQTDMIPAGPSSLNYIDSSNSIVPGPFHPGIINPGKVVATPILAETPMQVASAELLYGQSQNPTQSTSIPHSLVQDVRSQNKGMADIDRKRTRSSEPSQDHQLSIFRQQLSKKGVPECSLNAFCFQPQPKRQRTITQKQSKNDVQNAGGACVLCFMTKKKVLFIGIPLQFLPNHY